MGRLILSGKSAQCRERPRGRRHAGSTHILRPRGAGRDVAGLCAACRGGTRGRRIRLQLFPQCGQWRGGHAAGDQRGRLPVPCGARRRADPGADGGREQADARSVHRARPADWALSHGMDDELDGRDDRPCLVPRPDPLVRAAGGAGDGGVPGHAQQLGAGTGLGRAGAAFRDRVGKHGRQGRRRGRSPAVRHHDARLPPVHPDAAILRSGLQRDRRDLSGAGWPDADVRERRTQGPAAQGNPVVRGVAVPAALRAVVGADHAGMERGADRGDGRWRDRAVLRPLYREAL